MVVRLLQRGGVALTQTLALALVHAKWTLLRRKTGGQVWWWWWRGHATPWLRRLRRLLLPLLWQWVLIGLLRLTVWMLGNKATTICTTTCTKKVATCKPWLLPLRCCGLLHRKLRKGR